MAETIRIRGLEAPMADESAVLECRFDDEVRLTPRRRLLPVTARGVEASAVEVADDEVQRLAGSACRLGLRAPSVAVLPSVCRSNVLACPLSLLLNCSSI